MSKIKKSIKKVSLYLGFFVCLGAIYFLFLPENSETIGVQTIDTTESSQDIDSVPTTGTSLPNNHDQALSAPEQAELDTVPSATAVSSNGRLQSGKTLEQLEQEILKIDEAAEQAVLSLYEQTGGSEEEFQEKYKNVLQQ